MGRAESVEVDVARLFPALSKDPWKGFAQAETDALAGFFDRPQRFVHCRHQEVERLVDRRPAVDQRIVPIEQDRPRSRYAMGRDRRKGHFADAACAKYVSHSLLVSDPGCLLPTAAQSILTIGRRATTVLVMKASRADFEMSGIVITETPRSTASGSIGFFRREVTTSTGSPAVGKAWSRAATPRVI